MRTVRSAKLPQQLCVYQWWDAWGPARIWEEHSSSTVWMSVRGSVLGGGGCSHPLCLDLFLPVIPISVAMTADAEHVGDRQPHPLPLMKPERHMRAMHSLLFSDGLTDHKKCTVTDITRPGRRPNITLPQLINIYTGSQTVCRSIRYHLLMCKKFLKTISPM